MAAYIDDADWERKNGFSGHLIADSLDELHQVAAEIGLTREAFNAHAPVPHYQLHVNKRSLALQSGAVHLERTAFTKQAGRCRDLINREADIAKRRSAPVRTEQAKGPSSTRKPPTKLKRGQAPQLSLI